MKFLFTDGAHCIAFMTKMLLLLWPFCACGLTLKIDICKNPLGHPSESIDSLARFWVFTFLSVKIDYTHGLVTPIYRATTGRTPRHKREGKMTRVDFRGRQFSKMNCGHKKTKIVMTFLS